MSQRARDFSLDFHSLRARYAAGALTPTALVEQLADSWQASQSKHVWIHLASKAELLTAASVLEQRRAAGEALPLYGLPFAVKDNIDVAGMPTTAACPGFSHLATKSAFVVERLLLAGALVVGKANLDQLATGLVGVRSPYGVAENPFDAERIPGGSSSGSAVVVSAGVVSFALGTDTAGSGRVPASFNNLVGLKPTCGLLSTSGVVPACRSLDCVSIFALTAADAAAILDVAAKFDSSDPFARREGPARAPAAIAGCRVGVPRREQLEFFGNRDAEKLFAGAVAKLTELGAQAVEID